MALDAQSARRSLWLTGMLTLAPLRQGWSQLHPPQHTLVPAMLAGVLFATAWATLNWPWQVEPDFPVSHGELMAGAINAAWRSALSGLGLGAALALAWHPRAGPTVRQAADEALPVRWFAAVAATMTLWSEAHGLWSIGAVLLNRFLTHREFPDFLLPSLQPTLLSLPSMSLQAFSIACWLLIAFRPCRPHAAHLAWLALSGLVLSWLVRQLPLMWATWQGFHTDF